MNFRLTSAYSREEVELTLKQMVPLKSFDPNSFDACPYQQHWSIIGNKVSIVVLDILCDKDMSHSINSTFIFLISKKDNPKFVSDFRSISLCNVFYKLVSKAICNRVKSAMSHIIFRMQSA